jgi:N6-L-threonylcarbamoyladenine synthase
MTLILGIETSCDETSAAIVRDGRIALSNVIASQVDLHARYGGVFPEVASRAHVEAIGPVVEQALSDAGVTPDQIDAVAVTRGPGLAGSLLVGVNFAKGLALGWDKPLLGINHIEGHVYSLWIENIASGAALASDAIQFPALCLVVSGGHTELIQMDGHGQYRLIGATLDDAAGEAFDKVGRVLGLPYPGGPSIDKAARLGNASAYNFIRPTLEDSMDFSFSGLKTAVMRAVQAPPPDGKRTRGVEAMEPGRLRADVNVNDAAASFQVAAVDQLVERTVRAARACGARVILIAGGVSANSLLRAEMERRSRLPVRYPALILCTDNAAMIGAAGYYRFMAGQRDGLDMDVAPMLALTQQHTT